MSAQIVIKNSAVLLICFFLICCRNEKKNKKQNAKAHPPKIQKSSIGRETIQYSDLQLRAFLDSVGKLPTSPLANKVSYQIDSIFRTQKNISQIIALKDLQLLKNAIKTKYIKVSVAKNIFKDRQIDSTCTMRSIFEDEKLGFTPISYFQFSKKKEEYAICIGDPEHCENAMLYFFKGDKIISRHNGGNRYGLELKHFKDIDEKTVIYYRVMFNRGSGIWWEHFFFYKYDGEQLIPILNELQNGNKQIFWGHRALWLESFVKSTNPLTIKMVYSVNLPDTTKSQHYNPIIDDSTTVKYVWNEKLKILDGQYNVSKISKAQILSYYVLDNELLFINANYINLKKTLNNKKLSRWTYVYLNKVRNDLNDSEK